MELLHLRAHVDRLFRGSVRETTRIGVEHELLTVEQGTGGVVPPDRIRAAARGRAYASYLAFEPGGQVELSLPCRANPDALALGLSAAVTRLRADCDAVGVELVAAPIDRREGWVPLQLETPRYLAMQRHFDTIGPAGRRMMRRTASTQICLDWWSGARGLEQWKLLNLAGPFLAAASSRSDTVDSRLATWLEVDTGRTAFDGRLLAGDDPTVAYAAFAARAAVFTDPADVPQHLSTLFPPVRPRGRYLEVRFLDVQPLSSVRDLARTLSALMYDGPIRAAALRLIGGTANRLEEHWRAAAVGGGEVAERGRALVALALGSGRIGVVA
jgi:gamma-glutamylcysteine synthetase